MDDESNEGSMYGLNDGTIRIGNSDTGMDYNITQPGFLTLARAYISKALYVMGKALIAGFYFTNQYIISRYDVEGNDLKDEEYPLEKNPKMILDGLRGSIRFNNHVKRWAESGGEETKKQYILLDSSDDAKVEARNETDGDVAYMSSQGVFANRAGIDTLPASSGVSMKASIVGLGYGRMDNDMWGSTYGVVGVFGTAHNSSSNPAPAYGGLFNQLKANGLILNTVTIEGATTTNRLSKYNSLVVSMSNNQQHVYLPVEAYRGTTIWLKQWTSGYIRVYAPLGQKLYDDGTENEYIDIGEGWTAMCVFLDNIRINNVLYGVWLLSKFKF